MTKKLAKRYPPLFVILARYAIHKHTINRLIIEYNDGSVEKFNLKPSFRVGNYER